VPHWVIALWMMMVFGGRVEMLMMMIATLIIVA
jgi:hypothetical protein